MRDIAETSAGTALFRKGAEQIVLDHDKQAKLANLIKAVTIQKQQLTEERERAIAGFKAERAKLRAMQQKTLSLYAKMKTEEIAPVSVDMRDVDSSDDEEGTDAVGSYDNARRAGFLFASLLRGSNQKLIFERWRSWAKRHAAADAHVNRMKRRWELTRLARMMHAWWRFSVHDSHGTAAAAEKAVLRSKKRVGRRAFAGWRGIAAGLSEEELAKLSSASAKFVAGSPAAGLIAVAQLARSRGGTDAVTRRRIVGEAVAAAERFAGAFDVEDILGGAEGTERFLSPTSETVAGEDILGGAEGIERCSSLTSMTVAGEDEDPIAWAFAMRAAAILFGKTVRGTLRNVVMAWSAAASRARARRLTDEVNALRFEQAEAEALAMVASEERAAAESEKKPSISNSFFSSPLRSMEKSMEESSPTRASTTTSRVSVQSPSTQKKSPRAVKAASVEGLSVNEATASSAISSWASTDSSATSSAVSFANATSTAEAEVVTPPTQKLAPLEPDLVEPERRTSVASSSEDQENSLPPAPDSPVSTSFLENALPPAPEMGKLPADAIADVDDVHIDATDAAKTWSEDPPVDAPRAEEQEEPEQKQPACCVLS
jgi:hypothetical protein